MCQSGLKQAQNKCVLQKCSSSSRKVHFKYCASYVPPPHRPGLGPFCIRFRRKMQKSTDKKYSLMLYKLRHFQLVRYHCDTAPLYVTKISTSPSRNYTNKKRKTWVCMMEWTRWRYGIVVTGCKQLFIRFISMCFHVCTK